MKSRRSEERTSPVAERPFSHIAESGAPRGEKFIVFVNPPVVNRELGIRRSYLAAARRLAGGFLPPNLPGILFPQPLPPTHLPPSFLKDAFRTAPGLPRPVGALP